MDRAGIFYFSGPLTVFYSSMAPFAYCASRWTSSIRVLRHAVTSLRHHSRRTHDFALDVEFLKTKGQDYARAVAFVPFSAASSTTHLTEFNPTAFEAGARLLALSTATVMQESEALPAGHALLPLLQTHMVSGPQLESICAVHEKEARKRMEEYTAARLLSREQARRSATEASGELAAVKTLAGTLSQHLRHQTASSPAEEGSPPSPSPRVAAAHRSHSADQHRRAYRQHQMRVGALPHFETFDPYSFPNLSFYPDTTLRAIYEAEVSSSAFQEAAQCLVYKLRAYGKGRGRFKSIAFLLGLLPSFTQDVLRASFASSKEWLEFAALLRSTAEKEVNQLILTYRERAATETRSNGSVVPPVSFHECVSLQELSLELSKAWASLLYNHQQTSGSSTGRDGRRGDRRPKIFAYGSADNGVIKRTLALSCQKENLLSEGKRQKNEDEEKVSDSPSHIKSWASLCPLQPLRTDRLMTPHQARMIDITSHPLYAASGFLPPSRLKPSLLESLKICAARDATAAALLKSPQPHDPIWDAQALGCVCVASRAVVPPNLSGY